MSDLAACSHPSEGSISIQFLVQMDQKVSYNSAVLPCPGMHGMSRFGSIELHRNSCVQTQRELRPQGLHLRP